MPKVLDAPTLDFTIHDDGTLHLVSPWYQIVAFAVEALARADGRRVAVRGDEVMIRCTNGRALYALGAVREPGFRWGVLVRTWAC